LLLLVYVLESATY